MNIFQAGIGCNADDLQIPGFGLGSELNVPAERARVREQAAWRGTGSRWRFSATGNYRTTEIVALKQRNAHGAQKPIGDKLAGTLENSPPGESARRISSLYGIVTSGEKLDILTASSRQALHPIDQIATITCKVEFVRKRARQRNQLRIDDGLTPISEAFSLQMTQGLDEHRQHP